MDKTLKQSDLDPAGFTCNGGRISPAVATPAFNCGNLGNCSINSLSDVSTTNIVSGDLLSWDGTQFVGTQLSGGTEVTVVQTAHGLIMPAQGFIAVYHDGTGWVEANTTTMAETHVAFITSIPSADSLVIQQTGVLNVSGGHGLIVGSTYYLQDDGSIALVEDSNIIDKVVIPVDVANLLLLDDDAYESSAVVGGSSYTQDFITTDFTGVGPYELTITAATHGLGATKYIIATVYENGTPNSEVETTLNVDGATGEVVVVSNSLFDGYLILRNF